MTQLYKEKRKVQLLKQHKSHALIFRTNVFSTLEFSYDSSPYEWHNRTIPNTAFIRELYVSRCVVSVLLKAHLHWVNLLRRSMLFAFAIARVSLSVDAEIA